MAPNSVQEHVYNVKVDFREREREFAREFWGGIQNSEAALQALFPSIPPPPPPPR